jgi:hypothetical protein
VRARALMLVALAGAGCWSTTTVGSAADPRAQRWFAENAREEMRIETTGRGADQTGIALTATSPTDVSFRTTTSTVVPIAEVRRLTVVKHGRGALEGALIGAAGGAALGALYGLSRGLDNYERSMDCTIICNNTDAAEWGALMFGVVGLVTGLLSGAVIGHQDMLELR